VPGIISVAAVDRFKERAEWSRVSPTNDISAPGVDVESCYPGNKYAEMSGTSMATPHASGAIALYIANNGYTSIEELLEEYSEKLGDKRKFGCGLIRPDMMLKIAKQKQLMYA